MAEIKALVKRRNSAKNIKKITKTMSLIAAAKFKAASNKVAAAKPYSERLNSLVADLLLANEELQHPLIVERKQISKVAILVVTSNRGLCGAYNAKIVEHAAGLVDDLQKQGKNLVLHVVGKRGVNYFSHNYPQLEMHKYLDLGDSAKYAEVDKIAQLFITQYLKKEVDKIKVVFMSYISASKQYPKTTTFLPFPIKDYSTTTTPTNYLVYPNAQEIAEQIIPQCISANFFRIFLEAAVSEHISRMIAMNMATENAEAMIKELTRLYNRARQAQITNEISEIMGAVRALQK